MNEELNEPVSITRRDALQRVLTCAILPIAASLPVVASAAPPQNPTVTEEFVPEDDYPFFGYAPTATFPAKATGQ